jgi:hypothetical protein
VQLLDEGCCGMAGTFGYEAEHYELSQQIAALRLVPRISESPGAGVAATGAACRMQIAHNTNARVAHPLVWVRRALDPTDQQRSCGGAVTWVVSNAPPATPKCGFSGSYNRLHVEDSSLAWARRRCWLQSWGPEQSAASVPRLPASGASAVIDAVNSAYL